jgi:lambda family phage portal protein
MIAAHREPLTESRYDIRASWRDIAAISKTLLQNSPQLKGAADQIIVDTVGAGLRINFTPDLSGLGMSEAEQQSFRETVEKRYKQYRSNPREVDHRGRLNMDQCLDIGLRYTMAFGEITAIHSFFKKGLRRKYGIETGSKLLMLPPSRLVQDTDEQIGLFQGVFHDDEGRPVKYRFKRNGDRLGVGTKDFAAIVGNGLPQVSHIFDPQDATDVRGVGAFASAISRILQSEKLDQVTLKMAILQTNFAISLTSDLPSSEAFEALEALEEADPESGNSLAQEYIGLFNHQLEKAQASVIKVGDSPHINSLAPGEKLDIQSVGVPGSHYLPLKGALSREAARAIGISSSAFTMDYTNATYSSVRMETAQLFPMAGRRRKRTVEMLDRAVFSCWLDEQIATGRIEFGPGYRTFVKYRHSISQINYFGPGKPTADDLKSAKAANERVTGGQSSLALECAENGQDFDEIFEMQRREHNMYVSEGMMSPYARKTRVAANEDPDQYEDKHGKSH